MQASSYSGSRGAGTLIKMWIYVHGSAARCKDVAMPFRDRRIKDPATPFR